MAPPKRLGREKTKDGAVFHARRALKNGAMSPVRGDFARNMSHSRKISDFLWRRGCLCMLCDELAQGDRVYGRDAGDADRGVA